MAAAKVAIIKPQFSVYSDMVQLSASKEFLTDRVFCIYPDLRCWSYSTLNKIIKYSVNRDWYLCSPHSVMHYKTVLQTKWVLTHSLACAIPTTLWITSRPFVKQLFHFLHFHWESPEMEQYLIVNLPLFKKVWDVSHFILVCIVLHMQLQATHAGKLREQFKNWTLCS